MDPRIRVAIGLASAAAVALAAHPAAAQVLGRNGRVAFTRTDPVVGDTTFLINSNGHREKPIGPPGTTPRWSPDGRSLAIAGCAPSVGPCASTVVRPDTGSSRALPKPAIFTEFSAVVWSPDGSRLAGGGESDTNPAVNGVYTVRARDGHRLTRLTHNPNGAFDIAGDYSPDGKHLVFIRTANQGGELVGVGLFVITAQGKRLRRITPPSLILNNEDAGSWSPRGNRILFAARTDPDHRNAIWAVKADGTRLHRLPIRSCGGLRSDPSSIGCFDPAWAPDGTRLAFIRFGGPGGKKNVYTVKPNGTHLRRVTSSDLGDSAPDWGRLPSRGAFGHATRVLG